MARLRSRWRAWGRDGAIAIALARLRALLACGTSVRSGGRPLSLLPEHETLHLACAGPRQRGDEFDGARVLVRRDPLLDEVLQFSGRCLSPWFQDDEGLDDLAACLVGHADDGALGDIGVAQQHFLDLRPRDAVAAGDDHVVGPGLEPEVAIRVPDICIAGQVPAVLNVAALPLVAEVTAAGRALDGEAARLAVRYLLAFGVEHRGGVSRDGDSGCARPDVIVSGRDEDVQHLGAADAVDDLDAGSLVERRPRGLG